MGRDMSQGAEKAPSFLQALTEGPLINKAKSPFWEMYVASGNNITHIGFIGSLVRKSSRPPRARDREPIAVQIKQLSYIDNLAMTTISVAVGIRHLYY